MDTGLGAKAYAIIEQGKIGLILSSRPTDRRQLIEEAAGVTKYKSRRRAAELKLEAAQQNLTRIDDIVFEVEKQRGTLKRQAAKARRYQKLRDEMRRWEKAALRAASTGSWPRRSSRRAPGWPTRASASRSPRRASPRSSPTSAASASSWPRPSRARPASARPRTPRAGASTAVSSRSRSTRSRSRHLGARIASRDRRARLAARRGASRRGWRCWRAQPPRRTRRRERERAADALAAESEAYDVGASRHRRARGRRRGGAQRGLLGHQRARPRCATRWSTPAHSASASSRR